MLKKQSLKESDSTIFELIEKETRRQEFGLEMIPSENFVSEAILEACGSILTNKYAEGLPGKRYYGGCEVVDEIEQIAIDRAKKLFEVEYANVQPHSGATANEAVFEALLNHGDTIMGLRLDHGGHLTHGHPMNFSGKHYQVVAYGVNQDNHLINYDEVRDLALKHKPKLIIAGASAYSRKIDFKVFGTIAKEVGAYLMADIAHYAGLIAAKVYPSPVSHADVITTTTHKTLRGPRSGLIMAKESLAKPINKAVFPGLQGGPHMHTISAKAVCFMEAMRDDFRLYSQQVISNAQALANSLSELGLDVVSGGTDSHIVLVDVRPLGATGKEVQECLDKVNITGNKNTVPYDPLPPTICSGFRMGTPALTTRGMKQEEMKIVANFIHQAILAKNDESKLSKIKNEISEFSRSFPLYAHRLV